MNCFRRKTNQKGFTMIELMVVVVIVGVLSAVAVPLYSKYIKNARVTEATGRIGEIVTASKTWAMENQDASGNPTWPSASGGIVDLSASDMFTYAITAGGGANATSNAYTITATGAAGDKMAGVTVAVTVADIYSNGGAPVVTGL
jgi:prepilin-type N-terminal cleavage/methylation domain-containing protein